MHAVAGSLPRNQSSPRACCLKRMSSDSESTHEVLTRCTRLTRRARKVSERAEGGTFSITEDSQNKLILMSFSFQDLDEMGQFRMSRARRDSDVASIDWTWQWSSEGGIRRAAADTNVTFCPQLSLRRILESPQLVRSTNPVP